MSKSNLSSKTDKPKKPHKDFPLFPHNNGMWCKKIRGKLHYFGPWRDPQTALEKCLDEKDDLLAGRTPQRVRGDLTVRDLFNKFLTVKTHQRDAGEITHRTFRDYHFTCRRIGGVLGINRPVDGLASEDFERLRADIARTHKPLALGVVVQRIRTIFRYAYDADLIKQPVRFGPTFKSPSGRVLRREKQKNGERTFSADEIRLMLDAVDNPQLKAQIYLGINAAFGNSDIGNLPLSALDLENDFVTFPRPKTAISRRCWLWPETVQALRQSLEVRPEPNSQAHTDRVFITSLGNPWASRTTSYNRTSVLFVDLLKRLNIYHRARTFYSLRHTFRTVADQTRDFPVLDLVMGHADQSMGARYRHEISDQRLREVGTHVRSWLFETEKK